MHMKNKIFFILLIVTSFNVFSAGGLFNSGMTFLDENGANFNLNELQGKRVLMSMAYTTCQGSCPLIISRLKNIEAFYKSKNINPEIVIVTYDHVKDRPKVMHEYMREKMGVKGANWHFIVGDESSTRFISMALGIKFSKNNDSGMILHDNKVVAFDSDGKVVGRIEKLGEANELLIAKEER